MQKVEGSNPFARSIPPPGRRALAAALLGLVWAGGARGAARELRVVGEGSDSPFVRVLALAPDGGSRRAPSLSFEHCHGPYDHDAGGGGGEDVFCHGLGDRASYDPERLAVAAHALGGRAVAMMIALLVFVALGWWLAAVSLSSAASAAVLGAVLGLMTGLSLGYRRGPANIGFSKDAMLRVLEAGGGRLSVLGGGGGSVLVLLVDDLRLFSDRLLLVLERASSE